MSKTSSLGEIDGKSQIDMAIRAQTFVYDTAAIDVSGSSDEDISIEALFGAGTFIRQIMNNTAADGNVLYKTKNTPGSYQTLPIISGAANAIMLPEITHIKKTGSLATVIVNYQKINQ